MPRRITTDYVRRPGGQAGPWVVASVMNDAGEVELSEGGAGNLEALARLFLSMVGELGFVLDEGAYPGWGANCALCRRHVCDLSAHAQAVGDGPHLAMEVHRS